MSAVYAFLLGLGTPIVSMALAGVEVAFAFSFTGHLEKSILIGAIVLAIGVLGPGAISIDAKLHGGKLIVIR